MKERFKGLAEKANLNLDSLPDDTFIPLEKFAELIVRDIINVLESTNEIRHIASTTYDISMVEGTIDRSINAITEHYGMKQHHRIKNERTLGRKVSSL
jgi:hypothetical protein